MLGYFARRFLMMFPLMLLISFVAFGLIQLAPTDPAVSALRMNDIELTDDIIAETRESLGLNQSFVARYAHWLGLLLQGDLGRSFINHQPVLAEMAHALPTTLALSAVTFAFIFILSLLFALFSVWWRKSPLDSLLGAVLFLLSAMPSYWLGLLLIWGVAVQLDWLPVSGIHQGAGLILPALALSLGYVGTYVRLLRGAMLNQLQQPYVFYAKARGLSDWSILSRHVLPNGLHTLLIALGMGIPKLLAGAVVIENIFALPGIGRLCIQAIFSRDLPMIQGYILLMSALFLLSNFAVDLLQYWRDPRLTVGKK